jgi:putative hydrolase of the HAD superfamily
VGDSYGKDILPAHSIGCHTVWLRGIGWADEEVDETLPTAIISDLKQVVEIVHA